MNKYLSSWDKIRIIPQPSRVNSRTECNISCKLGNYLFDIPLLVASMHSLVTPYLIRNVEAEGSGVIQPRLKHATDLVNSDKLMLSTCLEHCLEDADRLYQRTETYDKPVGILSIEIANGYMYRLADAIEKVKQRFPDLYVLAGTVADYVGAKFLQDSGADGVLLGIGVSPVCETTIRTGVGLPPIASLMDLQDSDINIPIILCGGVRNYGDFCKAIALGADFVMSGSLFAGCLDTKYPNRYWGEASETEKGNTMYVEGIEITVERKNKSSNDIIVDAKQALRSAMSYSNSIALDEFRRKVKVVEIE